MVFLLLSVASAATGIATPLIAGDVVNTIVDGGSAQRVVMLAAFIAGVALLDAGIGFISRWLSSQIGEGLILHLRTAVFDHVQRMPIAFFMRTRTGALVSRLNGDVNGARSAFTNTLSSVVSNAVTLVLTLIAMFSMSWQITLFALILLPVFVIPAQRMGPKLADLQRESANLNASMSSQMTERFSAGGATLVKLFGNPGQESASFANQASMVRDIGIRTAMSQFGFRTALTLVSSLALALVYGLGGYYAVRGTLDAGAIVALAMLLTRLYGPITGLANARIDVLVSFVSFERVFEILDLKPMIAEPEHPVPLPEGELGVSFDHVSFTYPSAEDVSLASLESVAVLDSREQVEVLHDVSFDVRPGSMVALVGSSGSGKSTISQLIPRLYDASAGTVRLGGVDVRDLAFDDLRHAVGMVTQDGHMFHDTLRENLRIAKPDATDDELWQVLERVNIAALVRTLPHGLETIVGERGYRFSGGERQRLTIARLLLAHPRVVILDEATAHLDSTSEALVQAALAEAMVGRTALVIAHRLSTIRAADEILVIEAGRVAERGTHQELLALDGRYAELYHTQFAEEVEPTAAD
ncbi:MAG TPA: ABC transporter ATP-binding protein [Thermomicrobiales bacterium]|nr:ABC transporter ATP-binding protein [Thermomicrobiales bacterium]